MQIFLSYLKLLWACFSKRNNAFFKKILSSNIHTHFFLLSKLSHTLALNSCLLIGYIILSLFGEIIQDILMADIELISVCVRRKDILSQLILFCDSFLVENKKGPHVSPVIEPSLGTQSSCVNGEFSYKRQQCWLRVSGLCVSSIFRREKAT